MLWIFLKALIQLIFKHIESIPTIQTHKIPSFIVFLWGVPIYLHLGEDRWDSSLSQLPQESPPSALFLELRCAQMSSPTFWFYPVVHVIFVCLFKSFLGIWWIINSKVFKPLFYNVLYKKFTSIVNLNLFLFYS